MERKITPKRAAEPGPGGLPPGHRWADIRTTSGRVYRTQVPLDWGSKSAKAAPARGGKAAPRAPALPEHLELLKTNRQRYVAVPRSLVPEDLTAAAEGAAKAAAAALGIPVPSVMWVAEPRTSLAYQVAYKVGRGGPVTRIGPVGRGGWLDPDRPGIVNIVAKDDLDVEQVGFMVAHEVRHSWQARLGEGAAAAYKSDPARWEDDADEFAERFMAGWGRE